MCNRSAMEPSSVVVPNRALVRHKAKGWARYLAGLLVVVVMGSDNLAVAQSDAPRQLVDVTVASVSSGDTIVVSDGTQRYKIWLDAIDAPEPGQQGFAEARKALSELVLGRKVRVDAVRPADENQVWLGRVYCEGHSINKLVVDAGWAWYARGEQHFPMLAESQETARDAGLGIWKSDEEPVAPWEHRAMQQSLLAERREAAAEKRRLAAEKRRELKDRRQAAGQPAVPTDLKPGMPSVGDSMYLEGLTVDGRPLDWSAYAGKVVLVDFWATWCGPCMRELPNVLANYEQYHERGFEVVGVCLDEDRRKLTEFLIENQLPWENLFSDDPRATGWKHPMAQYYQVQGIPTVILVGRDGRVASVAARGEALGRELAKLFDEEGEAAANGSSTTNEEVGAK